MPNPSDATEPTEPHHVPEHVYAILHHLQHAVARLESNSITLSNQLQDLRRLLHKILTKEIAMSVELDALTVQVAANNDLVGSAVTLIQGLRQQILDAGTDPAKLKALTDSLGAKDTELAAALVAGTTLPPPPATAAAKKSGS